LGAQLAPTEITFRRRQTHELAKATKLIAKELPYLVEKLIELTKSKDEKIVKDSCTALMKYYQDCVETQEKDSITRALLEIKYGNGSKDLSEIDNMPMINFNEIQSID
jgi:hypothetical protein